MTEKTCNFSADDLVARRIRQSVQSMQAYAVQDAAAGMVKLDAMENPYPLPVALQEALGRRLGALALNRYPGSRVDALRSALASYAHMPEGFDIMLGNGSDELITLLGMACAVHLDAVAVQPPVVLAPTPSFVMYALSAQLQGLSFVGVPLSADFALDLAAMQHAIMQHQPALVYLAYPNNPTANLWDEAALAQIVLTARDTRSLVVLDEAYQPFSRRTYLDVIRAQPERHAHVVLMRTMSKFGLAGARIGYLMGPRALIEQINKVRPPYNISVLNCECALFALEHADVFLAQAQEICTQRSMLVQELRALPRVHVWDSDANMVLLRLLDDQVVQIDRAQEVYDALKARGVLVKNVSKMHPLLSNCLRVTVGTATENQELLLALRQSL